MTFESAQTNFQGQQGWNDLAPDAIGLSALAQKNNRGKARPRRVATPILPGSITPSVNGNSTPPPLASAPPQSMPPTSAPPAVGAPPIGAPPIGAPPVGAPPVGAPPVGAPPVGAPPVSATSSLESDSSDPEVSIDDVKKNLSSLADRPSALAVSETELNVAKIQNQLTALPQQHLQLLNKVLQIAPEQDGKQKARKMLVDYGLLHSNVTGWTVPVRRLIDQQR